jgi:hypothetical protein
MDEETITALAKGLMPVVRECVADAVFKIGLDRHVELPPALAEQTATAMRLLQELPPIMPSEKTVALPPRVLRIERDEQGALVPIYEESSP